MANTNPQELEGFLGELGLGAINQAEAYEKGIGRGLNTNQTEVGQFAQIGQQLGRGVGRAGRGLFEAVKGARGEGTFNFSQGVRNVDDAIVARGAGIAGGAAEVQSRRSIRKKIAQQDFGDLKDPGARIKLAEFVAEQAQLEGNATAQSAALAKVQALRKEKVEFDKLDAQKNEAQSSAIDAGVVDVVIEGEDERRSAQWARRGKQYGVEYTNKEGEIQFAPAGTFKRHERAFAGSQLRLETIGSAIARNTSSKELEELRNLTTTGLESVRKMGRVMDTINDLNIGGNADQVISAAGGVNAFMDQTARNMKGILKSAGTAVGIGRSKDAQADPNRQDADGNVVGWQGFDFWTGKDGVASDAAHPIWDILTLPPEMQENSAQAQNYRAQIMELMYMAARLAEPSNRGLSDNDIINAAKRLGGNTANPAVMMRRFAEMMHDSAAGLENELDVYYGAVEFENFPVPEGMTKRGVFEAFVGNKGLTRYREELTELRETYNFTVDDRTGRATFMSPIDADVNPLDSEPVEAQSDEDFLSSF